MVGHYSMLCAPLKFGITAMRHKTNEASLKVGIFIQNDLAERLWD